MDKVKCYHCHELINKRSHRCPYCNKTFNHMEKGMMLGNDYRPPSAAKYVIFTLIMLSFVIFSLGVIAVNNM